MTSRPQAQRKWRPVCWPLRLISLVLVLFDTVNGIAASQNVHTTNFAGYATVAAGTNVVPVAATDSYGNSRTNRYQLILNNSGTSTTLTYDLNGNQVSAISSSATNTYEWDAADRLTAINSGVNRSEFTYDGLGRRVKIVEKQNGTVQSTKNFLWCAMAMCEERDSTGATVTKRFPGGGEQISGTNYYFSSDHLGSVRELTDGSGAVRARYDYDPYGRTTKLQGNVDTDFAFTGHHLHQPSGLDLAPLRAYDPNLSRWTSRDPLGEFGDRNLYSYVGMNPANAVDSLGLTGSSPIEWHHNAMQAFRWEFAQSKISINDARWGTMFAPEVHDELHARGFIEEMYAHFYPRGDFVPSSPVRFSAFLEKLQNSDEYGDLFALGIPATEKYGTYRAGLGRVGMALGAVGLLASLATVSASAERISCDLKNFARDNARGDKDWGLVDALDARQELNARAPFAGDTAMRSIYGW